MEEEEKTCFIIMPITTPDTFLDRYRDRVDHFNHVLECLFVPAVEAAGYKAIPPTAKGSDLIQAEIIRNLESSDLILCDMSCLNPNVFFEFGIRTSLNKPVCVVKDEHTSNVPFDTSILNHQEYQSSLEPWELKGEVEKLADHIRLSFDRSKGKNTLWHFFGLKAEAQPYKGEKGTDVKLDFLSLQIDSLREKIDTMERRPVSRFSGKRPSFSDEDIKGILWDIQIQLPYDVTLGKPYISEGKIDYHYFGPFPIEDMRIIGEKVRRKWGILVNFHEEGRGKPLREEESLQSDKPPGADIHGP